MTASGSTARYMVNASSSGSISPRHTLADPARVSVHGDATRPPLVSMRPCVQWPWMVRREDVKAIRESRLLHHGVPVTGSCDLQFVLRDQATGGTAWTLSRPGVAVTGELRLEP